MTKIGKIEIFDSIVILNPILGPNSEFSLLIKTYTIGNNLFVYYLKSGLLEEVNVVGMKYELFDTYMYMYPASSMFSIRGIDQ